MSPKLCKQFSKTFMTSCAKGWVEILKILFEDLIPKGSLKKLEMTHLQSRKVLGSPLVKSEVEIVTQVSSFSHLFLTVRQKFSHAVFFQAHLLIVLQIVTENFLFPPLLFNGLTF